MLEDFRLKVFATVAEDGNFTKAAKALGISQPAVSQNISELERIIGTALFRRSAAKVSLTPQGELLMHYAERILAGYNDIQAIFGTGDDTPSSVRIHADKSASVHILPEIINTLHTANPGLNITVTDNKESADICLTSTLYRKSGSFVISFQVSPKEHPLTPALQSLIDRQ